MNRVNRILIVLMPPSRRPITAYRPRAEADRRQIHIGITKPPCLYRFYHEISSKRFILYLWVFLYPLFNFFDLVLREPEAHRANGAIDLTRVASTDNRPRHCRMPQCPCNRHFTRAASMSCADLLEQIRQREVAGNTRFVKFLVGLTPVIVRHVGDALL